MHGQLRHVFFVVAQRRHKKWNDIEPVEQIFAKVASGNLFVQIFVGRGNHSYVHAPGFFTADRSEALLIERAQHLGLRLQAHVTDFVEKQRSSMRLLEFAFFFRGGAGKRALTVAKHLAFDQIFRDGGAVDLDEGLVFAQALRVHRTRDQFFSRPRLAIDEHAPVGWGHESNLLSQRFHGHAVADNHVAGEQLLLQVRYFAAQLPRGHGVADQDQQFVDRERLFQEVVGAKLGGADRCLNGGVPGDHDDFGRRFEFADLLEDFQTVGSGQPNVEQDHVVAIALQTVKAGLATFRGRGGKSLIGEHAFKRLADAGFIVDNQNAIHALILSLIPSWP